MIGTNFIHWRWTNPTDADFKEAIVYLNGINVANTSTGTYPADNLAQNTSYTLTVNTVNFAGDVNRVNVSDTETTGSENIVDTTPPGAVTNLTLVAKDTSSLSWRWTNPTDADFKAVLIYLNGTNVANTTNSYYNALGLLSNTTYTLTLHTIDASGNINTTDVTDTETTQSSTVPIVTPVHHYSDDSSTPREVLNFSTDVNPRINTPAVYDDGDATVALNNKTATLSPNNPLNTPLLYLLGAGCILLLILVLLVLLLKR